MNFTEHDLLVINKIDLSYHILKNITNHETDLTTVLTNDKLDCYTDLNKFITKLIKLKPHLTPKVISQAIYVCVYTNNWTSRLTSERDKCNHNTVLNAVNVY